MVTIEILIYETVSLKMLKDWKLKLRYGRIETPYEHFTLIAPVIINQYIADFNAQPGKAYAAMKIWALNDEQSIEIFQSVADQTGFSIAGNIEIYKTEPENPPKENPFAYNINFSYYTE